MSDRTKWTPVPTESAGRYARTPVGEALGWTGDERWVQSVTTNEAGRVVSTMRLETTAERDARVSQDRGDA